jgi:hypothetical protein
MGRGKSRQVLELVAAAKAILEQIQPATVRAVCYRLFVAGVIGSMTKAETNRVIPLSGRSRPSRSSTKRVKPTRSPSRTTGRTSGRRPRTSS